MVSRSTRARRRSSTATPAAGKRDALTVIRRSADLDPRNGVSLDIGPGARGGNSLGANDGHGHDVNPATGKPYAPNVVLRGDYARALAEYWADGPRFETPPGHWNPLRTRSPTRRG